jgi:hypothetical protein
MGHITRTLAASAATILLGAGVVGVAAVASADGTNDQAGPCVRQTVQVAKAEDALARVTAVFERKQAVVDDAEADVAEADTPREKAAAKVALRKARAAEVKAAKAKKAQQMRLTKAQERLDTCLAGQSPTEAPSSEAPTEAPTETPSTSESPVVEPSTAG